MESENVYRFYKDTVLIRVIMSEVQYLSKSQILKWL